MNSIKTFILMGTLTILLILLGGSLGGRSGATFAFIFSLGMNLFSYWFSDSIVLKIYKAQEVNECSVLY